MFASKAHLALMSSADEVGSSTNTSRERFQAFSVLEFGWDNGLRASLQS